MFYSVMWSGKLVEFYEYYIFAHTKNSDVMLCFFYMEKNIILVYDDLKKSHYQHITLLSVAHALQTFCVKLFLYLQYIKVYTHR